VPELCTRPEHICRFLQISHYFRCSRIQGLDTVEGLLLFGKEHLYIIDGLTILRSREVRDCDSLPAHLQEPILPSPGPGSPRRTRAMRQCSKFHYEDIRSLTLLPENFCGSLRCISDREIPNSIFVVSREVHKRRYLLQPMALEVFSSDGRNYLLAFQRKVRNKVYQK